MSKVLKLRAALQTVLKDVHARVWYESAPDGAAYPYLVYHLEGINDPTLERYILDVDGWDAPANGSTVALETLMGDVDDALHKRVVNVDGLSFVIYLDRRLSPTDDDPRIRRRRYTYEIRTFEKRRDYHG